MTNKPSKKAKQCIHQDIVVYSRRYGVRCPFCDKGQVEGEKCTLCNGTGYVIKVNNGNNALKMYDRNNVV